MQSRKVISRLFQKRLKEHTTYAKLLDKKNYNSKFYYLYLLNKLSEKGKYKYLDIYIYLRCYSSSNEN